jgi:pyridoxine/pyridoxamine 5'-phosphate oxidase
MHDPLALLADDRTRARDAGDPWANLCVVATVDAQQNPQARVVVLRDLERRFAIFINGTSPKHQQLALSRRHAVLVYLASLGVQYRLTVLYEPVPEAIVHASWSERPRIPKVMDWLYEHFRPQSSQIDSRDVLMDEYAVLDRRLADDVAAPARALGYYLLVEEVERLELAGDRPHARVQFQRANAGWRATTLMP